MAPRGMRLMGALRMKDTLQFDAATLRRYDRPAPRYTSYPTAPHFDTQFTEAMLREHIVEYSNAWSIPRRLSLYVHVPTSSAYSARSRCSARCSSAIAR